MYIGTTAHTQIMKAPRLIDSTTDLRCIICLYILVAATTGDQTDSVTCRDTSASCRKMNCGQPGIDENCRRTCGRCNLTDCAVGMYRNGDSCTACQRQSQDDHDECTRTCPVTGRWGEACDKQCGDSCQSLSCYQWSGECVHGCTEGRYGRLCDLNCEHCVLCGDGASNCARGDGSCICGCREHFYGVICDNQCDNNCLNTSCNSTTGACTHGCNQGMFGKKCKSSCSNKCLNGTCYQNGSCIACVKGHYGKQCREKCSRNCGSEICSRDGSCSPCKPGYFKTQCQEKCSDNCLNRTCSQNNGTCYYGCVSDWHGDTCAVKCPANCATDKCSRDNGSCADGCIDGSYGQHCNLTCSSNCTDMECTTNEQAPTVDSKNTTHVVWSAIPCILIAILLLVLTLFVRKRRTVQHCLRGRQGLLNDSANNTTKMQLIYPSNQPTSGGNTTPVDQLNNNGKDASLSTDIIKESNGTSLLLAQAPSHSALSRDDSRSVFGFDPHPCHVTDTLHPDSAWSTEVSVLNLSTYVEIMRRTGGFSAHCADLPRGKLGSCHEAELPENAFKNRYSNILPYDHCRVKLTPIPNAPGSDYINASYINGYGASQEFVATQGPYGDVIRDFWRMTWEIDASKIIMLTNCVENRKAKCEKYWPDFGQPCSNYDDVHVQCVAEEEMTDYTVRTFSIHREAELPRTLKQYHFTAWPDKGVPEDVRALVDVYRLAKNAPSIGKGPTVVHCSAGVGRTGTWIALDYLIEQAKAEGAVDVFACIVQLRHQRMNVIQTQDQYIFLHEALMEALQSSDKEGQYDRMRSSCVDIGNGDCEVLEDKRS
ncbi:receptor-type tyrosine-protein phosphatase mu-like [Haliotis rufescens]|uniref:receptor-type tyrosine-protein phosphatase mu-like n=2 Tax=Haliotis rufescens TaxID=6454 RepID=UPI00201ED610|nr:receptor-type tyrosine-protein phosphatase mu-like [Haliotis rufescens]